MCSNSVIVLFRFAFVLMCDAILSVSTILPDTNDDDDRNVHAHILLIFCLFSSFRLHLYKLRSHIVLSHVCFFCCFWITLDFLFLIFTLNSMNVALNLSSLYHNVCFLFSFFHRINSIRKNLVLNARALLHCP